MDGKKQNNPGLNAIRKSEQDSIRPSLPGQATRDKEAKRGAAQSDLASMENNAAGAVNNVADTVNGVNDAEEAAGGYWAGAGKNAENKGKGKGKGFLKKGGPIGIIIALLLGVGGFMIGGQTMQPFALANRLIEEFNTTSISNAARSKTIMKSMFKKKTKVSTKVKTELESNGIKVETDSDGYMTKMSYDGADGQVKTISSADEFSAKLKTDADFKTKFTGGTKTYGGNAGGYFDSTSQSIKSRLRKVFGLETDNRYADYDASKEDSSDPAVRAENEAKWKETADIKNKDMDIKAEDVRTDEDDQVARNDTGEIKAEPDEGATGKITKTDVDGVEAKLSGVASKAEKAVKPAQVVSGAACIFAGGATAVATIVIAQQISDMMNIASGYLEATQKVQAGDGNASPIHLYENEINQVDAEGKGFMTSKSVSALFGGNTGGESAGVANLENIFTGGEAKNGLEAAGVSVGAWTACLVAKAAANVLDLIVDVATLGASTIVEVVGKVAFGAAAAIALNVVLSGVIKSAVKAFTTDVITNMNTEAAGDYTVAGADQIMAAIHRGGGGSPGTATKVAEYNQVKQEVIAERADYDRATLSPFDTSSRYTFLGSLAYSAKALVVNASGRSLTETVTTAGQTVNDSIVALLPTTSAIATTDLINQVGECPLLESVDAVGTALNCNYYGVSDTSTFDMDIDEVKSHIAGDLEDPNAEVPRIKKGSNFAKYVDFCANRDSHLGLMDANITNQLHLFETNVSVIDGAIGAVPVVGALIDLINVGIDTNNAGWISGANCVAGGSSTYEDTTKNNTGFYSWETNGKYYQAYMELQRVEENMALIDTTSVAMYLKEEYAENPLDESYEGRLARITGMTKEQVTDTLAYMEYLEYVANYDASERYAFSDTANSGAYGFSEKIFIETPEMPANIAYVMASNEYADVRNRAFAVA